MIVDESQRRAARVIGISYLLALVLGSFAEFYVNGQIISLSAVETAHNIAAHETLFRLGIAANIMTFLIDVPLIAGLYLVLERVDRTLALMAVIWRLIETVMLFITALADFNALKLLSGAPYLQPVPADQLQALARAALSAHGATYNLALLVFGVGSTLFCYLWYKSGYIPKWLAGWGMFASALVGAYAMAFIIDPGVANIIPLPVYAMPAALFEFTMGWWMLIRGLRAP